MNVERHIATRIKALDARSWRKFPMLISRRIAGCDEMDWVKNLRQLRKVLRVLSGFSKHQGVMLEASDYNLKDR